MNKIFSFGKRKEQSPSRPSNKPPNFFGVQIPNPSEGYLIRSKDLGKIHRAALRGDVAKVQQLLLLGKNSVNDLDKVKRTPLHLACANGQSDVVCLLVERKCQLNLLDKDNRTPLMKAIECRQEECATILLEHGADPNLGDARNNNALHYIASGRTKFMAEKLVKYKIDIEAKNKEGLTPLLLAISTMNFEMAGFLLKNGANVNALDSCKRTALMIAVSVESIGLVTLLLQNNADYTLQDIAGWTAQTYAERYGYPVHIYHKQIEKQLERNNSCPPQISCSEETSGTVTSLDKKAEESSSEDSISRLSYKTGPDETLPMTDDELDFDTECSHESLLETSARRLFVFRNQNIKEKISLRKSEDFIEEFDLTDTDDIDGIFLFFFFPFIYNYENKCNFFFTKSHMIENASYSLQVLSLSLFFNFAF
ncbi:ankyrin repeat domain-containing protein 7-like [Antechinus flavipes]|uniref:ankyrin repeat domain-containing protein 7-like n=1 Tax=Antechinus flavipes TaxID=38775 RepID=UPI0022359329|nr:ankyrin repeat domain-containing protein 7-like [Antechinus flavipes]